MPYYYSLSHNRITSYYQSEAVKPKDNFAKLLNLRSNEMTIEEARKINGTQIKPEKHKFKSKKPGVMSKHSRRKIISAINWLALCSQKRNTKLRGGKIVKDYKLSLITLKLPAEQVHTDKEIKSKVLNRFLTDMRTLFGWDNYVWKAELQKNGNIHFHIVIDRPLHYMIIRKYWNKALSKLGYIRAYQNKFAYMGQSNYIKYNIKRYGGTGLKWHKAWLHGDKTNWKDPNSTDVKTVTSADNVAAYLSKYLAKNAAADKQTEAKESRRLRKFGRFWSLSQSVSKLGNVKLLLDKNTSHHFTQFKKLKKLFKFENEFVECLMFGKITIPEYLRQWKDALMVIHADLTGYNFPAGIPEKLTYGWYESLAIYQCL